jgi:hypothetical protein
MKFEGEGTLLLFVTSSFPFSVDFHGCDEHVIASGFFAASTREQPSIAATKSNTVPPASHAKQ